ncbi:MAG: Uncharacterised protein [Methanobacteriota archaeon]|nr:MAG: Uncharacterised protein [Euryarchaeota archaeon]
MADDTVDEVKPSFIPESPTLGRILTSIGIWALLVDVINILYGAYAAGQKVVWAGFLTYGYLADNTHVTHDGTVVSPGDMVFTAIALVCLGLGFMILQSTEENGFVGWLQSFLTADRWTPFFDASNGTNKMIGNWMTLIGLVFYFGWSGMNMTWVDPGVYAITIPLIGFGLMLPHLDSDAENA